MEGLRTDAAACNRVFFLGIPAPGPLIFMKPTELTSFIILCGARTGSTMLRLLLNSHPEVCCHGEVMAPAMRGFVRSQTSPPPETLAALRDADPAGFMREFLLRREEARASGFKIKYEELILPGYAEIRQALVEDESLQIIHLTRVNRLARLASRLLAANTGVRLVLDPAKRPTIQPFRIDPDFCRADFELMEAREKEFREAFSEHPILEVTYESLLENGASTLGTVQWFLGVAPAELSTPSLKIAPDNVQEIIENYVDLQAHFLGTRFQSFFQ
jgi:LPS sulfotransferase NodH